MRFELVGDIESAVAIARGVSVRQRARLVRAFGRGRWRKMKGEATVLVPGQRPRRAEIHWYEAHGIGPREHKIKRYLD
jgi:hypothetical protein